MNLRFEVEHRAGYSVIRVQGEPSVGQFLSFLQVVAVETAAWTTRRVLFDLRGLQTLTSASEHAAIGEAAARQLPHLQRIASLVEPQHITCEPPARRSELGVILFTDEAAAVAWLSA